MRCSSVLAGLVLALAVRAAVQAQDYKIGSLVIERPWIRATPNGAKVAGGYLTIINNGTEADRLVGGVSPFAGRFEVHEMKMENGMMQMRPLPNGLEIKPGQTVRLDPGGYHIMFMDLKQPLKPGDQVKGELQFAKAGKIAIQYAVIAMGAAPPARGMDGMGGH